MYEIQKLLILLGIFLTIFLMIKRKVKYQGEDHPIDILHLLGGLSIIALLVCLGYLTYLSIS